MNPTTYEIKHKLFDFNSEMENELVKHIPQKGDSWKTCGTEYLIKKLHEHAEAQDWVGVANFAFMLRDLERDYKKPVTEPEWRTFE